MIDVTIRAGTPHDHNYVIQSWVRANQGTAAAKSCHRVYYSEHHATVAALLRRPTVHLTVACLPDDPDALMGWAVTEPDTIHYVLVRAEARRQGIARQLLSVLGFSRESACQISHVPHVLVDLPGVSQLQRDGRTIPMRTKSPVSLPEKWTYNPYRAFR